MAEPWAAVRLICFAALGCVLSGVVLLQIGLALGLGSLASAVAIVAALSCTAVFGLRW